MAGEAAEPVDCEYKLIVTGSSGTGKTCLWKRLVGEEFPDMGRPIVSISCDDTRLRTVQVDNTTVRLSIIDHDVPFNVSGTDTAAERDDFLCIHSARDCDGCFVVYDATDEDTFNDLPQWLKQIQGVLEETSSEKPRARIMLLGNKGDNVGGKAVDYIAARDFAESEGIALVEVSAKDGTNVEFALLSMIAEIVQTHTHSSSVASKKHPHCTIL